MEEKDKLIVVDKEELSKYLPTDAIIKCSICSKRIFEIGNYLEKHPAVHLLFVLGKLKGSKEYHIYFAIKEADFKLNHKNLTEKEYNKIREKKVEMFIPCDYE